MGKQSMAAGIQGMMLRCAERQVSALGKCCVLAPGTDQGTWNGVPSKFLDRDSSTGTEVEVQQEPT